ncbi:MAG: serine hydrolase domain-containing protein [Saprospiraceae bacterium]
MTRRCFFFEVSPLFLFLFSLLLVQSACAQSDTVMVTPEFIGSRFVTAINSSDPKVHELIGQEIHAPASIAKNGIDRLTASFLRHHNNFAPLEYHHAERLEFKKTNGSSSYVLHVYARKKGAVMWSDFQFYLDTSPPHLITNLVFVAEVAEPIALPNGSIEQRETLDWLNGYIEKLERENGLSGSIRITKDDTVLLEKHWGYANIEQLRKINAETSFGLASGSKMFTALAIMQLQEQGKLKLSDKLTDYLPDFPRKEWAVRVSLEQMLSHTSGIAEYWTSKNETLMFDFKDWHQFLPLIYNEGFLFEPGTEFSYSNSNFMLLGYIIEKVSGQDYYEYISKNILVKADMKQSGYFLQSDSSQSFAWPYARKDGGGWQLAKRFKNGKGSPAGGCYSNVNDIAKFCKALKSNQLVSSSTLKNMVTNKTIGVKDAQAYGLGFILEQHAQEHTIGHGGTASGVNFEFRYFPGQDISLVVFCNQNNGAYDDLKRNALKLISGAR